MNSTILILNLLASSISIARSIDATTANIEDGNYKLEDTTSRVAAEIDDDITKTDDIITTSELNKIYSSEENNFAKTRTLKDETEGEKFRKADLKQESRVDDLKSGEKLADKSQANSDTNEKQAEIETKVAKREESTLARRTNPAAKVEGKFKVAQKDEKRRSNAEVVEETKSGKKEQSKVEGRSSTAAKVDDESKDAKKEENRAELVTSELVELEGTTESLRREVKAADYLENYDDDINDKIASDEDSERKGYEILVNDESNSAWDVLDDIPSSRRMLSLPANLNIELKAKAGNENVGPVEARIVPETKTASKNHIAYGPPKIQATTVPQFQRTVSFPLIYPTIFPGRRFIVPGFVTVPTISQNRRTFDIRRQNQETNNIISQNRGQVPDYRRESNVMDQNQNVIVDPVERSEIPAEFRNVVEDFNSKENSNEYPYTPPSEDLKTPKILQTSTPNPIFAKLIEASEHPQTFNPNINENNVLRNIQNVPFNNYVRLNKYANSFNSEVQNYPGAPYPNYVRPNNYAAVQNYGNYKYGTGFGRSR